MARVLAKCPVNIKTASLFLSCRKASGYVVLLPEVPSDTPESNPLLRTNEDPVFNKITKDVCRNGVTKLALELESRVWRLEESLQDPKFPKTFENIVVPMEDYAASFDYAWSIVKTLNVVKSDFISSEGYSTIHNGARRARSKKYQSLPIYLACKEINANAQKLDEPQKRWIKKFLLESKLSGVELIGNQKLHLLETVSKINETKEAFNRNLQITTSSFRQLIIDPKYVSDMPPHLLKHMAKDRSQPNKGPWLVTLTSPVYQNFLEYCPERALRWNTWQAYNIRASGYMDKNTSNSIHIEDLRMKRKDQAKLLGFENYVDLSMETKMAGNVFNVKTMIATLLKEAKPTQVEELSELKSFAASRGFESDLKPWDIPFWRRKQRKSLFNVDEILVSEYFPFPGVWSRLCKFAEELFGILIRQVEVETWDKDASFFEVLDSTSGAKLGGFYVDPYARAGQKLGGDSWMLGNRNKYDRKELQPLATMVFNFQPPLYGKPSLLSYIDVYTLFEKFGTALQHVLTTIPYHEVSGTTNIEWDAVLVPSKFMSMWLGNKELVKEISGHFENEDKIPDEMLRNLLRSRKHMSAFDLCHQLYISAFDLEVYTSENFWVDIMKKLWPVYHDPLEMDKKDSHPCSFQSIFSGDFAAAYYSSIWSHMLAADAYELFVEAGKREQWKHHGLRFRSSFLAMGGGRHPSEVFRSFRGRDPSPNALLWSLGIKPMLKVDGTTKNSEEEEAEGRATN